MVTHTSSIRLSDVGKGALRAWRKAPRFLRMVGTMASARDETPSSVAHLITRGARRFPDRIAIADDSTQISYAELDERVTEVAVALRHLGLRQGDVAGLLLGNRIELLVVAAAVCRLGGVASMLNTTLRGEPLLHCLAAAPPRILVVGEELAELREAIAADDPQAVSDELGDVLFALTSLARHLQVDAEQSLRTTLDRFSERFSYVERHMADLPGDPPAIDQLERLWQQAKIHVAGDLQEAGQGGRNEP